MELLVMLDVWIGLGLLAAWLAGRIWKTPRPFGALVDFALAVVLALLSGAADWFILPALGIEGVVKIIAAVTEPPLVALFGLWLVRRVRTLRQPAFDAGVGHAPATERGGAVQTPESEAMIAASALTRDFGKTRAVDALNLTIEKGELFGLVGPDGAGKTTTLRLLAGLLDISGGSARVAGRDLRPEPEAVKPGIGYMAQQFSLYGDLSVWENMDFFADLYDVTGPLRRGRIDRLLQFAQLGAFRDRRAANLSGGMQKKLALACTLLHQPDILLLDEPTTGVDPVSRREFWDILTELHLTGATIIVSTPYMDEAERCQRVGLMYAGRLIVCDEPRRIQSHLAGEMVEFRPDDWQRARDLVAALPGVLELQTYGNLLRVFLDSAEQRLPDLEAALQAQGVVVHDLRRTPARMEEAFISLIRQQEHRSVAAAS